MRTADKCAFCNFDTDQPDDIIEQTELFTIVACMFSYDVWDSYPITEHLLLVPRRHVLSIHDYTPDEQRAYMELLMKYDKNGYTTYARSHADKTKSVPHQHTHLLKLGETPVRHMYYSRKPHVLWYR